MLVPPPHEQRSQQQQQQADTHAAHDEARVVLLMSQRHLAQMPDGVRLPPLKEVEGVTLRIIYPYHVDLRKFWPKSQF